WLSSSSSSHPPREPPAESIGQNGDAQPSWLGPTTNERGDFPLGESAVGSLGSELMAIPSGGASAAKPKKTRSNTLRQAASAVFALTAIVPLLLFVWTVHYLGALSKLPAQVGLGLALAVALVGYFIFRGLMGRMSDLILALGRVVELRERSSTGARAGAAHGPTPAAAATVGPGAAPAPARAGSPAAAKPAPPAAAG